MTCAVRFVIGVPWRGGDSHREASWRVVRDHLQSFDVIEADADPADMFSRAASCNLAVGLAKQDGIDVVVLHDADMLVPVDAYPEMAAVALRSGRMVIGYTEYRALTPSATLEVHNGADPWTGEIAGTTEGWSVGGVNAIRVDAFGTVGGYDERFRGWGCEDFAFATACNVALGQSERTTNPAVHLWHEHGTKTTAPHLMAANSDLLARYTACRTTDDLAELIGERADR